MRLVDEFHALRNQLLKLIQIIRLEYTKDIDYN